MKRMVNKAERLEKMAEGDPDLVKSVDFLEQIEQPTPFFNKAEASLFDLGQFLAFKIEISGSGSYSPFTKVLFIDFTQDLADRNGKNPIWSKTRLSDSFMQSQVSGIDKIEYLVTSSGINLGLKVYINFESAGGGGGTDIDYYIFPKGL